MKKGLNMKSILKGIRPFKIPLIILGGFMVVFIVATQIIPMIKEKEAKKTPIVSIKAESEKLYIPGDKILPSDFDITATHKNGKHSTVNTEEIELSTSKPNRVGKSTDVTITLKSDPDITTTIKVKNKREKVTSYFCGNPNIKDVKAVVYSNGELCFEGKGDVLQFERGEFPWLESSQDITAVSFEKNVSPVSMDYWFEEMENLTYISPLPESVESIVGMAQGCIKLKNAPEWNNCKNLLDATLAYEECEMLESIPAIPASVRNASSMCEGCINLQTAPDMTAATSLVDATGMLKGCLKLTSATISPAVQIMDAMFQDCINLKEMPRIPESVRSMSSAFSGDTALSSVTNIPSGAQNISGCFTGCSKISGELVIHANPNDYAGFLSEAANATQLNLTGSSKMLDVLANTNDGSNIAVNGKMPNPEA